MVSLTKKHDSLMPTCEISSLLKLQLPSSLEDDYGEQEAGETVEISHLLRVQLRNIDHLFCCETETRAMKDHQIRISKQLQAMINRQQEESRVQPMGVPTKDAPLEAWWVDWTIS